MNIASIVALLLQLGPLGIQLFTALESRLNLTNDEKTNIANAIAASNAADDATIAAAAAWMKKNGFVMQFTLPPPAA